MAKYMTARELLSRAVDYVSDKSIDCAEMRANAVFADEITHAEECEREIMSMSRLLNYLEEVVYDAEESD